MRTVKGSFAIILKDNKIFVVKRELEPFKGMFWLSGGLIEENENPEETVKREFKEETGFDIKVEKFVGVDKTNYKSCIYQIYIFKAKIIGGKEKKQNNEIGDIKWMGIKDFIENLRNFKFPEDNIKVLLRFVNYC